MGMDFGSIHKDNVTKPETRPMIFQLTIWTIHTRPGDRPLPEKLNQHDDDDEAFPG